MALSSPAATSVPTPRQATAQSAALSHYVAGNRALAAGDHDIAVREYRAGEAADPDYALNYLALANLEVRDGDYKDAEAQLERFVVLSPRTPSAHYFLALVLEALHKNDLALKNLNEELRINPSSAPARQARKDLLTLLAVSPQPQHGKHADIAGGHAGAASTHAGAASPRVTGAASAHAARVVAVATQAATAPQTQGAPSPPAQAAMPAPAQAATAAPTPAATPPPTQAAPPAATNGTAAPAPRLTMLPASATPKPGPSETAMLPIPSPSASPFVLTSALKSDAKGYLLSLARDTAFTQVLPPSNAAPDLADIERSIEGNGVRRISYESLLSDGTGAFTAGRPQLARQLFAAAAARQEADWRANYFEGLAAQADGDLPGARSSFLAAWALSHRAAIMTSIAILDARLNKMNDAVNDAGEAAALDAAYQPAQLTAGFVSLAMGDTERAVRYLETAISLGNPPDRTSFFLDIAQRAIPQH